MQKDMMMMMMGIKLITELWNLLPLKRSVLEKLCVAFDNIFFIHLPIMMFWLQYNEINIKFDCIFWPMFL